MIFVFPFIAISLAFFIVGTTVLHVIDFLTSRLRCWSCKKHSKSRPHKKELNSTPSAAVTIERSEANTTSDVNRMKILISPKFKIQSNNVNHYQLSIDMPGTIIDDINVTVKDDRILEIQAIQKAASLRQYYKAFVFDGNLINWDQTDVTMEFGVLNITLPKKQEKAPISIPIHTTNSSSHESENVTWFR
jgi:HSP20 family molecular chaperone IbpA